MSLPRVLRAVPVVVPISHAPEAKKNEIKLWIILCISAWLCLHYTRQPLYNRKHEKNLRIVQSPRKTKNRRTRGQTGKKKKWAMGMRNEWVKWRPRDLWIKYHIRRDLLCHVCRFCCFVAPFYMFYSKPNHDWFFRGSLCVHRETNK